MRYRSRVASFGKGIVDSVMELLSTLMIFAASLRDLHALLGHVFGPPYRENIWLAIYILLSCISASAFQVWSGRDFKLVKSLSGHEAKVTSLDIHPDEQSIATVSHDRWIKLWSTRNKGDEHAMDVD
ncbi:hypothetical protein CUMW_205270 [Citrus unshiu]|uniref:Uncharacterized protein n=1 Tax=Citrus unshiu TaxID=55188 RepID=A0A2H5Q8F4_CITUN|nr:hypothetical protein CUMW_205270 [Citrus unshiu]